ncbi:Phosphatidylinositol-3,4,5-trisphosphate-dependent Rac exchanger 1 protein [Clydaea vesicula]|uniref:Phosphatidylinositol-3,4, 5-trisphosphate-dependent Rac exchanger 1 protein n=1 Tax=Clydaea vesicula TaxID=447962 RepID=A0AAD5TX39_9FUNG|nr:Phosphatidylinositol-3,4,5-trisphosphate-dependent Rac exchanger 1 protein [Clydaea vesicula]
MTDSSHRRYLSLQKELIQTEEVYIQKLTILVSSFPLSLLSLTLTIKSLLSFQIKFYNSLLQEGDNLAYAFLNMCEGEFSIYNEYCSKHDNSLKLLRELEKKSDFMKFIKEFNTLSKEKLEIRDYLILPIQRICRYPLFLNELFKLTSPSSDQYEPLQAALNMMKKVISSIDWSKWYAETLEKTDKLFSRIMENNCDDLEAKEMFGTGLQGIQTNRLICGGEMLLGSTKKSSSYILQHAIKIDSICKVQTLYNQSQFPSAFRVICFDSFATLQVYDFSCSSDTQMLIWVQMLEKLTKEFSLEDIAGEMTAMFDKSLNNLFVNERVEFLSMEEKKPLIPTIPTKLDLEVQNMVEETWKSTRFRIELENEFDDTSGKIGAIADKSTVFPKRITSLKRNVNSTAVHLTRRRGTQISTEHTIENHSNIVMCQEPKSIVRSSSVSSRRSLSKLLEETETFNCSNNLSKKKETRNSFPTFATFLNFIPSEEPVKRSQSTTSLQLYKQASANLVNKKKPPVFKRPHSLYIPAFTNSTQQYNRSFLVDDLSEESGTPSSAATELETLIFNKDVSFNLQKVNRRLSVDTKLGDVLSAVNTTGVGSMSKLNVDEMVAWSSGRLSKINKYMATPLNRSDTTASEKLTDSSSITEVLLVNSTEESNAVEKINVFSENIRNTEIQVKSKDCLLKKKKRTVEFQLFSEDENSLEDEDDIPLKLFTKNLCAINKSNKAALVNNNLLQEKVEISSTIKTSATTEKKRKKFNFKSFIRDTGKQQPSPQKENLKVSYLHPKKTSNSRLQTLNGSLGLTEMDNACPELRYSISFDEATYLRSKPQNCNMNNSARNGELFSHKPTRRCSEEILTVKKFNFKSFKEKSYSCNEVDNQEYNLKKNYFFSSWFKNFGKRDKVCS